VALPGFHDALDRLRANGDRAGFSKLVDQMARERPDATLLFCLPELQDADRALLIEVSQGAVVRPCFGVRGATLRVRSPQAAEVLSLIGPDLGPGLVRLVMVPGLGPEQVPTVLERLPLDHVTVVRVEGNGVRGKQADVRRDGKVFHVRMRGDDRVLRAIAALPALRDLRLASNRMGPKDAHALAQLPLRALDLRANPLGDAGAVALAGSATLRVLRVASCEIGPKGALALSDMEHLEELDLSRNPIGDEALAAVAQMQGLKRLQVEGCGLSDDSVSRLQRRGFERLRA
jgi:hypothetical protein